MSVCVACWFGRCTGRNGRACFERRHCWPGPKGIGLRRPALKRLMVSAQGRPPGILADTLAGSTPNVSAPSRFITAMANPPLWMDVLKHKSCRGLIAKCATRARVRARAHQIESIDAARHQLPLSVMTGTRMRRARRGRGVFQSIELQRRPSSALRVPPPRCTGRREDFFTRRDPAARCSHPDPARC
jgi:hypothetical protein